MNEILEQLSNMQKQLSVLNSLDSRLRSLESDNLTRFPTRPLQAEFPALGFNPPNVQPVRGNDYNPIPLVSRGVPVSNRRTLLPNLAGTYSEAVQLRAGQCDTRVNSHPYRPTYQGSVRKPTHINNRDGIGGPSFPNTGERGEVIQDNLTKGIRTLVKGVQFRHHLDNWTRGTPQNIREKIDDLLENINPPQPDRDLRGQLENLKWELSDKIKNVITVHLKKQGEKNLEELMNLKPEREEEMLKGAGEICERRMGKKWNRVKMGGWMRADYREMGKNSRGRVTVATTATATLSDVPGNQPNPNLPTGITNKPNPNTNPKLPKDITNKPNPILTQPTTTVQPEWGRDRRGTKRQSHTTPSPISTTNRFVLLRDDSIQEEEEPTTSENRPQRKKQNMNCSKPTYTSTPVLVNTLNHGFSNRQTGMDTEQNNKITEENIEEDQDLQLIGVEEAPKITGEITNLQLKLGKGNGLKFTNAGCTGYEELEPDEEETVNNLTTDKQKNIFPVEDKRLGEDNKEHQRVTRSQPLRWTEGNGGMEVVPSNSQPVPPISLSHTLKNFKQTTLVHSMSLKRNREEAELVNKDVVDLVTRGGNDGGVNNLLDKESLGEGTSHNPALPNKQELKKVIETVRVNLQDDLITFETDSKIPVRNNITERNRSLTQKQGPSSSLMPLTLPSTNNNDNPPIVHEEKDKNSWFIIPKAGTTTLIIGDSNTRNWPDAPAGTEIHTFPGAYLLHASHIVTELDPKKQVQNIIFAVGINNREWSKTSLLPDINKCARSAESMELKGYFLGVSVSERMYGKGKNNVKELNELAAKRFGERFIPALEPERVRIAPLDPYKIHHDSDTCREVADSVYSFLGKRRGSWSQL